LVAAPRLVCMRRLAVGTTITARESELRRALQ
jgi:hypothetical protein